MKTIQMTIDEPLLSEIDDIIATLDTTRSAFIREALQIALHRYKVLEMEKQHAHGYAQQPIMSGEFDIWENEQAWGDA